MCATPPAGTAIFLVASAGSIIAIPPLGGQIAVQIVDRENSQFDRGCLRERGRGEGHH
jgi:hypothetical protein